MFDFLLVKNRYTEFDQIENICKSNLEVELVINLIKEIKIKGFSDFNIDSFFNSRAISSESKNPLVIKSYKVYDMIKNEFSKKEHDNIFLYLIENKSTGKKEIYRSWSIIVND